MGLGLYLHNIHLHACYYKTNKTLSCLKGKKINKALFASSSYSDAPGLSWGTLETSLTKTFESNDLHPKLCLQNTFFENISSPEQLKLISGERGPSNSV